MADRQRRRSGGPLRGPIAAATANAATVLIQPPCVVCGRSRGSDRATRYLTHGVAVWLCPRHGADEYLVRDRGETFVKKLAARWVAAGALTRRRIRALDAHLDRVRSAGSPRPQPGSYSWPGLRKEAERRFAAGEEPKQVIAELREEYGDGPALVPSIRTLRRWFSEARWLGPPARVETRPGRQQRKPEPRRSLGRVLAATIWHPLIPFPDIFPGGP